MAGGTQVVSTIPAPVRTPAVASHKRAAITGAAAGLDTFISGGIPTINGRRPDAVYIGLEAGSASTYVTWDGQSTPSATLGFLLPVQPSYLYLPMASEIQDGVIKVFASAGTIYAQCKFEWLT